MINCAGPFTLVGDALVGSAVVTGTHYADSTGEQSYVTMVFDRHGDEAERRGVALVPAMGFDYAPGDPRTSRRARVRARGRTDDGVRARGRRDEPWDDALGTGDARRRGCRLPRRCVAGGALHQGVLRGTDVYGLTAALPGYAASAMTSREYRAAGALGPAAAFDPVDLLDAMGDHGVTYATDRATVVG